MHHDHDVVSRLILVPIVILAVFDAGCMLDQVQTLEPGVIICLIDIVWPDSLTLVLWRHCYGYGLPSLLPPAKLLYR